MTTRVLKRLGLLFAICLAVSALVAVLLRPRLPTYNGQSLAFWFKNLPTIRVGESTARIMNYNIFQSPGRPSAASDPTQKNAREALKAIRAIGTNAVPFLIRKLKGPPATRLGRLAQKYAGTLPVIRQLFLSNFQIVTEQQQAVAGLLALCPLPQATELELRQLSLDFHGPAWGLAGDVLRANDNINLLDATLGPYR